MNYGCYTTPEKVKSFLRVNNVPSPPDGELLINDQVVQASRGFDLFTSRSHYAFVPIRETKNYNFLPIKNTRFRRWSGNLILRTKQEFVEIISIKTSNGTITISNGDVTPVSGYDYDKLPYDGIEINDNSSEVFTSSTKSQKSQSIEAIWCHHPNFTTNGWKLIDTVQNDPLTINDTELTVTDASLFETFQLIRFGDDNLGEFAYINTTPDTALEKLTIDRGVNGTTNAEQPQNTNVYVYQVPSDILQAATALAVFYWHRKDSLGGNEDRRIISPTGETLLPAAIPTEAEMIIRKYRSIAMRGY